MDPYSNMNKDRSSDPQSLTAGKKLHSTKMFNAFLIVVFYTETCNCLVNKRPESIADDMRLDVSDREWKCQCE